MSVNGFKIHPAADLFPMLMPDELQELADDIAENGQLFPIMLDHAGDVLIDGRNRLAACELAKVKPRFERLADNEDPLSFIASVNLRRRNLTKGQQAMAMAMMYPEAYTKKGKAALPFSKMRLAQARSVLHHSRSLAEAVLKGITPLDMALATVKEEQEFQQSDEAKLARLREAAPDLAEQVDDERLKINEAIAALNAREQELRQICEDAQRAARNIVGTFVAQVLSIVSGIEHGEEIAISEESASELKEGYSMFLERVIEKRR